MQVITSDGIRFYDIDPSGQTDVSDSLQELFDNLYSIGITALTLQFLPGIYYINKPLTLKFISITIRGAAHGGVDIHGTNLASGTIFQLGKDCFPSCLTFFCASAPHSFPAGQSPWPYKTTRISVANINFVGYNNTDVDTQNGYSRFKDNEPNFRRFCWYPAADRYTDIELEGQRAITISQAKASEKPEMLSIDSCYFTDLYVGLDIANCDVSNIRHSWFGQMVYGIRYHGAGQCIMMNDNCFADLETAIQLNKACMSTLHNNTFAYISKCFILKNSSEININSNVVRNWHQATGTATCGAFLSAQQCKNLTVSSNTVLNALDSRTKTRTVDSEPNGRAFVDFDNCSNTIFIGNLLDTAQTEPVVKLTMCTNFTSYSNMILYGAGGMAYTIADKCQNIKLTDQQLN
ncbi:NosD domain-containing protein [Candidatus Epulonipiscium viviparus]|uniref:NosD domain-containing protein n=1 Tax=Candidatus Epulonipiscium viviparus TaxID=420336 RepID=UPI002738121F|nr:NosD domain-containing protein [Candidatus Epulopiscium viviparus]